MSLVPFSPLEFRDCAVPAALNQNKIKLSILDTRAFATAIPADAACEVTKVHNGNVETLLSTGDLTFEFANWRPPTSDVIAFDTSKVSGSTGVEVALPRNFPRITIRIAATATLLLRKITGARRHRRNAGPAALPGRLTECVHKLLGPSCLL